MIIIKMVSDSDNHEWYFSHWLHINVSIAFLRELIGISLCYQSFQAASEWKNVCLSLVWHGV